ncbi:MAG: hypothetical protein M1818_000338 [Claussenomyces sp. TS43310]|nr:MAG: hypothetical protein M1818_000338 [Claussenomyces sp. TS43310]
MSPSRGNGFPEETTDTKADIKSSSALASAKHNFAYLWNPSSNKAHAPARLRTRALLRSLRYIGVFVFWRVVRYAKYALVGSIVAALGATAFGGVVSGVGFLAAPPTIATSLGIGLIWAVGKWGFRKMGVGPSVEAGAVREVQRSSEGVKNDGTWRDVQGPKAVPW